MIFVSSSCVKNKHIKDSVLELVNVGFKNIELSGGTIYYEGLFDDLVELKEKYDLNYLCHNYFPPPVHPFVVNLASTDDDVFNLSFNHIKNAIQLSEQIGACKFGFHAGFFFDPKIKDLGNNIDRVSLNDVETSLRRFTDAFAGLKKLSTKIDLYLENNVLSSSNFANFGCNPNMLTTSQDFFNLKSMFKFNLLLDVAHLKVTCHTMGLSYKSELKKLLPYSDYLHISDNDGLSDKNAPLVANSKLLENLSEHNLRSKDFTIEVYSGIDDILLTYKLLIELIK